MTTAADVLNVARSYLGVAENPPHSNRTVIGEKFGWNGVAWCAESVTVWQHEGGNAAFNGSASCSVLVGRYRDGSNGTWGVSPEPGDEGFLGASGGDHTFLVEANNGDGTITTIEGNWGDRVTRVTRSIASVYGFGRPNYDGATAGDGGAPAPSATGGRPLLRLGSTGESVKTLQNFLNGVSHSDLTVDGDFGPATEAALKTYQASRNLEADGVVGPQTWSDIDGVLRFVAGLANNQPAVPNFPPYRGFLLRLRSRGEDVRTWQTRMAARGWKITADGVFGAVTDRVVREFQRQVGLDVDGQIGPQTWAAAWTAPVT